MGIVGQDLDALDVPVALRAHEPDDTGWTQIDEWAGPTIPPSSMDAYEARLTAADLHRIASAV